MSKYKYEMRRHIRSVRRSNHLMDAHTQKDGDSVFASRRALARKQGQHPLYWGAELLVPNCVAQEEGAGGREHCLAKVSLRTLIHASRISDGVISKVPSMAWEQLRLLWVWLLVSIWACNSL